MALWRRFFAPSGDGERSANSPMVDDEKQAGIEVQVTEGPVPESSGIAKIEAVEAVGGRKGRYFLYAG